MDLYNMAAKDYELSLAICQGIKDFDPELIVLALSGGELAPGRKRTWDFAPRWSFCGPCRMRRTGSLVNRRKEGAMITERSLRFPV